MFHKTNLLGLLNSSAKTVAAVRTRERMELESVLVFICGCAFVSSWPRNSLPVPTIRFALVPLHFALHAAAIKDCKTAVERMNGSFDEPPITPVATCQAAPQAEDWVV